MASEEERWWGGETKVVVTGANRGIGFEIARLLVHKGLTVILTSRSQEDGLAATQSLLHHYKSQHTSGSPNLFFHQLDVQDQESISQFALWMHSNFNQCHILVNNAAVVGTIIDWDMWASRGVSHRALLKNKSLTEGFKEEFFSAKRCMEINYYGMKRVIEAMLPLLRKSDGVSKPRVVNVSSIGGMLQNLKDGEMRDVLEDIENVSEEVIDGFVEKYLRDVESGAELVEKGWPVRLSSYIVSKIAVNAYSRVLARGEEEVSVNCIHPGGLVRTGMTCQEGEMSASEAAQHVVHLALLPPFLLPSGAFYSMDSPSHF